MEECRCSSESRRPFMMAFNSNFAGFPGLQFRCLSSISGSHLWRCIPGLPFLAA